MTGNVRELEKQIGTLLLEKIESGVMSVETASRISEQLLDVIYETDEDQKYSSIVNFTKGVPELKTIIDIHGL